MSPECLSYILPINHAADSLCLIHILSTYPALPHPFPLEVPHLIKSIVSKPLKINAMPSK